VKTRLRTNQKVIALTFDACRGPRSSGYDAKLINYLKREKIPAALFISGRWIDANREIFEELAKNPLFEIENHGLNHKPCSVNGRSVYGIEGTKSVDEIFDEIEQNTIKIKTLIGVINHPSIVPIGLPLKAALLLLISLVRFEVLVGRVNSLPELSIDIF
jgi:peptidoglycan/xylan/chitin deacetylase (PgdA/CDA1 family)